ncbi:helix-turn-helix domain-containing protein [Chitinophaga agrisoli]|uniref:Helix-turn-helix domain-containing protein n=1 Tax=Chitinophaga agrisoli TaxID=2607653 RepID=A0A5B2VZ72_9BACT|nr:helix-turn-helix transcriptional regulator [Chitinophaga agrisoli]KAA2243546.1 helix-turn-helix domain-containing protein [Chitinophaga agrisoli]
MKPGIPLKTKIGAQLLKISPFKEVIKPTLPHKHPDYFELIVLSDGAGTHLIDDHTYTVTPPAIFFLKPGQTHCWDFTRIPKGYVLLFKEELLSADLLAIVYGLNTMIRLSHDDTYLPLLALFYEEYKKAESDLKVLTGYLQLLLQKTAMLALQVSQSPANVLYYQFKSLVHATEPGSKRVQDYAAQLNVSTQQLNAACREGAGKTPSMVINERLLLEAKTLLSATDLSIKEIALVLHFSDTSHFVKFFKGAANLTPGAYRELLAGKSNIPHKTAIIP